MPKLIVDYDSTVSDLAQAIIDISWATGWQQMKMPTRKHKIKPSLLTSWDLHPLFDNKEEFISWFNENNAAVLSIAKAMPESSNFLEHCEMLCKKYNWEFKFFSSVLDPSDYIWKYKCCKRQFGEHFANLLKVGKNKRDLFSPGDIVVDDYPGNLTQASARGAYPLCIKQPHNSPDSDPGWPGVRLKYDAVIREITKIMDRSGELKWQNQDSL